MIPEENETLKFADELFLAESIVEEWVRSDDEHEMDWDWIIGLLQRAGSFVYALPEEEGVSARSVFSISLKEAERMSGIPANTVREWAQEAVDRCVAHWQEQLEEEFKYQMEVIMQEYEEKN